MVPVDVALGSGTPAAWRARFLLWLLKSKPGMMIVVVAVYSSIRVVTVEEDGMAMGVVSVLVFGGYVKLAQAAGG